MEINFGRNFSYMCLMFTKMYVNRGQENLYKVFYRWRLSLICVAAMGSALDPPGGPDPLDSHARIRSLIRRCALSFKN